MGEAIGYETRRGEIATYFDRTAAETWKRLTSDAPVGRIRSTVRAGRAAMREAILAMLPDDLAGRRVLDAGCGTGVLAMAMAERGADVVAVDLSPTLVAHAADHAAALGHARSIRFEAGDMLASGFGRFDHVVLMDSLIHYEPGDAVAALASLAARTDASIVMTFAPKTPLLAAMHAGGRLFPKSDRAPSIVPVRRTRLRERLRDHPGLAGWELGREAPVASAFYKSHALELVRG